MKGMLSDAWYAALMGETHKCRNRLELAMWFDGFAARAAMLRKSK